MNQPFQALLSALIKPNQKVLVAVSGGLDSIVLLDLVAKSKIPFAIAHVNFQLRAQESDEDQQFVKQLANAYGIPFHTLTVDTVAFADKKKISKQMAARQLRYNWFREIMQREHMDYVLTAHHLNDNLETSLLNFARGSGISGLRGIAVKQERIIRPLLGFSRKEIEAYAIHQQLKWREDSSNQSTDYNRNFVRHKIVPLLRQLNPSIENTFQQNAARLRAEEELVKAALQALSNQHLIKKNNQLTIHKKLVSGFTHQGGILWEFLKDFGFNLDQCNAIARALDGEPGKQFSTQRATLTIDRETLIVSEKLAENCYLTVLESDRWIITPRLEISIGMGAKQFSTDPSIACLDFALLQFPLIIRNWKPGDYFVPLGMKSKKKVSDFLIDQKVSTPDKQAVLVLESEGKIAWVVGLRIDDRFKVTTGTTSIMSFKITLRNR